MAGTLTTTRQFALVESGRFVELVPPKKGDKRRDAHGIFTCMAYTDGWVMARRKGAMPVTFILRDWCALGEVKQ